LKHPSNLVSRWSIVGNQNQNAYAAGVSKNSPAVKYTADVATPARSTPLCVRFGALLLPQGRPVIHIALLIR